MSRLSPVRIAMAVAFALPAPIFLAWSAPSSPGSSSQLVARPKSAETAANNTIRAIAPAGVVRTLTGFTPRSEPGPQASAISDAVYRLLTRRVADDPARFDVYLDQDSGFDHGFASGFFGGVSTIHVDTGCIDDRSADTGCTLDPTALDRARGTVLRVSFDPQAPGSFAGVNFEEPENWGSRHAGRGYDLRGVTALVLDVRSPNGAAVQFAVGGCTTVYTSVSTTWTTLRIPMDSLSCVPDLSDVHLLFGVATNDILAPHGATVLLDNVRFEPAPAAGRSGPAFPVGNQTFGAVPRSDVPVPPDQVLRNLTTIYESALTELALLARATPDDLINARRLADTFDYALRHESAGDPLPAAPDGSVGLHNGYESGDLALLNDQETTRQGRAGDSRLAGFTATTLCPQTGFCLMLDGATGGNNAFAVLALVTAFRQFGDARYLDDASTIAKWIVANLTDASGSGYGGYFLGYPDQGVPPPKPLQTGKSIENNADIFAALSAFAGVSAERGQVNDAAFWTSAANVAGDFVMRMFDPVNGRFHAGTVPVGAVPVPGICPDGPQKGNDVINTCDFLDANSFTTLAMAANPRYRSQIDWRRPVQYMLDHFAQTITAGGQPFHGFNLVPPSSSDQGGIAWEFTGQVIAAMRYVDRLYSDTRFESSADFYLAEIARAQAGAPFADGDGLVAAALHNGDVLPPLQQCLPTPFQCIPARVGLAASTWAVFAEQTLNVLAASRTNPDVTPPAISILSPTPDRPYATGEVVVVSFVCSDDSGVASCVGSVPAGELLDTGTPGITTFTVTATDAAGNVTTKSVAYAVSLGVCLAPFAGLTAALPGDGSTEDAASGRDATWSGKEGYAPGRSGQAFAVANGSAVSLALSQRGPFTVQAWVATADRLQPDRTGIISPRAATQSDASIQLDLDGSGHYRWNVGGGELSIVVGPAGEVFRHLAITFDGSTIIAYLDGQPIETDSWMGATDIGFDGLTLGLDRAGLYPFSGVVDEFQVFNRALSPDEVSRVFLSGAEGFCKNRAPVAVAVATPNPAEATGPSGAEVTLDGSGSSDPDGDSLTFTWSDGSAIVGRTSLLSVPVAVGSHRFTLTVDDGRRKISTSDVNVVVRDTTAPRVQITAPSPDLSLSGSNVDVVVGTKDTVGIAAVTVNGVPATLVGGTPQASTWRATVPALLNAPGAALRLDARAVDTAGNAGAGERVLDNDGIPSLIDRARTTGADQSAIYSNEFNNGVTVGTLIRGGWTIKVSSAPTAGGIRAGISGAGSIATISACVGAVKEVRLDALGETADVTCDPLTGTITVKAMSALPRIELRERLATGVWQQFNLRTGQSMSVGSPARASHDNTNSIEVQLLQVDESGREAVVGAYSLPPGASIDVSIVRGTRGQPDRFRFHVLSGRASVTMNGRTRTIESHRPTTIERGVSTRQPQQGSKHQRSEPKSLAAHLSLTASQTAPVS